MNLNKWWSEIAQYLTYLCSNWALNLATKISYLHIACLESLCWNVFNIHTKNCPFFSEIPHSNTQSYKKYFFFFFFFQKQFTSFLFFFSSFKYNLHAMFCHTDKYHTVNWINDNYINLARKLYLFHGMNETKLYLCCTYSHLQ